jgi:hypothetical protein
MSHPETLPDLPNATSSPASAAGPTLSDLQASLTAVESGREALLASLSPRQAKALGLMTSGTYGPLSTTLPGSDVLQKSLENRLQAASSILGSTLYKLTWKPWATPSGRSRSRLRASVPRTSATAATGQAGWVTPTSRDWKDSGSDIRPRSDNGKERLDQLPRQANLCGWPTPIANEAKAGTRCSNQVTVGMAAQLTGWGTPTACDSNRAPAPDFTTKNLTLNHGAVLTGWPTPRAVDGLKGVDPTADTLRGTDLPTTASWTLSGWQTPCVDGFRKRGGARSDELGNQELVKNVAQPARLTASGQLLTGSHAGMASGGLLNPAHSRWLMGYPAAWDSCGATAMQSTSTPRKRSSKRSTGASE